MSWVRQTCVYSAELCLLETLMMAEWDTEHKKSAIPAVVPRFQRCTGKVEADMLLSLTRSDVFADQPRSHARVVTAQVWMLKHRESLTKRLFEHWLNISRSYKKQHGIGATVGKRGSPNQILCTAVTLLFGGFVSPVPMQINWTGFGYKDICDLNALHDSNEKKMNIQVQRLVQLGSNTSDHLGCLVFPLRNKYLKQNLFLNSPLLFEQHKSLISRDDLCTSCGVWIWNKHHNLPSFPETASLSLFHSHTRWVSEGRAQLRSFQHAADIAFWRLNTAH